MKPRTAREAAIEYAMGAPTPIARRRLVETVAPRDRGFFLELSSAAARRRLTLEAIAAAYCRPALDKVEPRALEIIVHALAEALFLDRSAWHAAVNEAVAMTRGGPKPRGFVNGVLRGIQRDVTLEEGDDRSACVVPLGRGRQARFGKPVLPDPEQNEPAWQAARHGLTLDAYRRLREAFDDDETWAVYLESLDRSPSITVRFVRGANVDDLDAAARAGLGPALVEGLGVHRWGGGDVAATTAFREGRITVQGPFASRIAPLVAPRPGERILDVCAAPGGKACHLAELAPDASVTALATSEDGRRLIDEAAARMGVTVATGLVHRRSSEWPDGPWDAILLDVPCSNSGVLDRRPEARRRLDDAHLAEVVRTQRSLLDQALRVLSSSPSPGRVVYSTCSILACEGAEVVQGIIGSHARASIRTEERSLPGSDGMDGGYVAVIDIAGA